MALKDRIRRLTKRSSSDYDSDFTNSAIQSASTSKDQTPIQTPNPDGTSNNVILSPTLTKTKSGLRLNKALTWRSGRGDKSKLKKEEEWRRRNEEWERMDKLQWREFTERKGGKGRNYREILGGFEMKFGETNGMCDRTWSKSSGISPYGSRAGSLDVERRNRDSGVGLLGRKGDGNETT